MQANTQLGLHEELLLLALQDEKGTVEREGSYYQYALAGALLVELQSSGCLSISDDKDAWVDLVQFRSLADDVLIDTLSKISDSKRRRLLDWAERLSSDKDLRHPVAQRLCEIGVLENRRERVLLIFSRTVYPTLDPKPEQEIIDRLRQAIFTETEEVSPKTAALLALANSAGLLSISFDSEAIKDRIHRIEAITQGDVVAKALTELMEAHQMAMALILSSTNSIPIRP